MSNYKSMHVGGGGNCVFFSAAAQMSGNIHAAIRLKLKDMQNDPVQGPLLRKAAKTMIDNQFKAGIINTSLNPELHGYNFKGPNAANNILNKVINTSGDDLNNTLALRLMLNANCTKEEAAEKNYLGKANGDIYKGLDGIPEDMTKLISQIPDKKGNTPSVLTISQMGNAYMMRCAAPGMAPLEKGEYDEKRSQTLTHMPTKDEISAFLKQNNADENNMIGLIGKGDHCKAFVNTETTIKDGGSLQAVTEERRSSLRGIRGFFQSVYNRVKDFFTGGPKESAADMSDSSDPEKSHYERMEELNNKDKSKSAERDNVMDNSKSMDDNGFDMVENEKTEDTEKTREPVDRDEFMSTGKTNTKLTAEVSEDTLSKDWEMTS